MMTSARSARALAAAILGGAALLLAGMATAGTCLPAPAGAPAPPPATGRPWEQAQSALDATMTDVRQAGSRAIAGHAAELAAVMRDAPTPFDPIQERDGKIYILSDGSPAFGLMVQIIKAAQQSRGGTPCETVMLRNPYPDASLLLGFYYNDVGRSADALGVLKVGLAQSPHNVHLIAETGAAYGALHQYPEALAIYQSGVALEGASPKDRARLLRGQGMALTELHRLDEAEQSYKDSLELEPGNAIALNELTYIGRLRQGLPPLETQMIAPNRTPSQ